MKRRSQGSSKTSFASPAEANAAALERDFQWFAEVLEHRLRNHVEETDEFRLDGSRPPVPAIKGSHYDRFLRHYEANAAERAVLLLALAPHVRPQLLDLFFARNTTYDREFTEFGRARKDRAAFIPTVETALFVLAGTDLARRFAAQPVFHPDHFLLRHGILSLDRTEEETALGEPVLRLNRDYLELFTTGDDFRPDFGPTFPARRIETAMDWDDLVLNPFSREQVREIENWLEHGQRMLNEWGMSRKLRPGYRALFHGPPGTGKTTTAALLGKKVGRDVYRIDLSLVVSKYIGETEKNLEKVFKQAENKAWILFFDEADALFGKRTEVADAHDRFANQEVSYLLQRIEDYPGLVLLATNKKANLDEAFLRRFQSVISFPMPRRQERERLWREAFSPQATLADDVDLETLAANHELAGGSIINAVATSSLNALSRGESVIRRSDLDYAIRKEFLKDGKTI